jgi:hypothetical protein
MTLGVTTLAATTYEVDADQYGVAMLAFALIVLLLGAIAVSLWRR